MYKDLTSNICASKIDYCYYILYAPSGILILTPVWNLVSHSLLILFSQFPELLLFSLTISNCILQNLFKIEQVLNEEQSALMHSHNKHILARDGGKSKLVKNLMVVQTCSRVCL